MDKPGSFYAQTRRFARKKEDEKFQQVVYVKYKLQEAICLLDVMNSEIDTVITNPPICNSPQKVSLSVYSLSLFFYSSQNKLEHWR